MYINYFLYCLSIILPFYLISANCELTDCWWTGCQNNNWAITGCEKSYNRTERNRTDCEDGHKYECCQSCKWTGCEKNDWAKKGCEHLGMVENRRDTCDNGNRYLCCDQTEEQKNGCWWTSCQEDSWAVSGCEQYDRKEVGKEKCGGGNKYKCCPNDNSTHPSPQDTEQLECYWLPCQYGNTTNKGCPAEAKLKATEQCEDGGEMYNCCYKVDKSQYEDEDDIEESSGQTFEDFVKYLLFKSKNFTIQPDQLQCTMLDPKKLAVLKVKEDGLRICDLCPNFPQKYLAHVYLNTEPKYTKYKINFGDCFEECFSTDNCMAYSYDHIENTCYMFESTIGTIKTSDDFSTVFMTQPIGILKKYSYIRHTSIIGNITSSSEENDFMSCLTKCEASNKDHSCSVMTYSLLDKKCSIYESINAIEYVDTNYGHISLFNLENFHEDEDVDWRFAAIDDVDILDITKTENTQDGCVKTHYNKTHSAYYSKDCLTNQINGCDSKTGCKMCYYPESVDQYENRPICPDSIVYRRQEIKKRLNSEMEKCVKKDACYGVGYNKQNNIFNSITLDNYNERYYDSVYKLLYPTLKTNLHKYIEDYEFIPNMIVNTLEHAQSNFKVLTNIGSYERCIDLFHDDTSYTKASYSFKTKQCHLGSNNIQFNKDNNNNNYVTIFKQPKLKSNLKKYLRVPNTKVDENKARSNYACNKNENCEEMCATRCTNDCVYVLMKYKPDNTVCYFYNEVDNLDVTYAEDSMSLVKTSDLNFTLESFNLISPFQKQHIYDCFSKTNQQTITSLSTVDDDKFKNNAVARRRRRRGLFGAIGKAVGKAFKKAGEFFVNTVKDTAKAVVDNVKGVAKTIGKAVTGDFKGAKDEFIKIPVVNDVKNVVELGGAVVTGDWDKAKEKGIDLLQSSTLDLATSVIPGGKILGTAAKLGGKALKGAKNVAKSSTDDIKKGINKNVKKVEDKNKKIKDDKKNDKKDNDKIEDRGTCERRNRRATLPIRNKRKKPCSDDDDSDDDQKKTNKFCTRPNIKNVIEQTTDGCSKKKVSEKCNYECEPGYQEQDPILTCKKIRDKLVWPPNDAKCDLESCGSGPFPLISLETPQASKFYKPGLGKFITAYVILFDKNRRLPIWSVAFHQSDVLGGTGGSKVISKGYNTLKDFKRAGGFYAFPCKDLNGKQGRESDYTTSGWHRGHLTPANVARWSLKAARSINLYINIAPQDPVTNTGPWKKLEAHVECFSSRISTMVATGVCLDKATKKTKTGGLLIPTCFWKMVCYADEKGNEKVVGFISDNTILKSGGGAPRAKQIFTPVSQDKIKSIMTSGSLPGINNPWATSALNIYKGRESAGLIPGAVNPMKCAQATTLDPFEEKAWKESLTKKKEKDTKKKKGKTKRDTDNNGGGFIRGCDSESELDRILMLLGINDGSDEGSEDIDDSDEDSNSVSAKEKADGISLVDNIAKCNKRIVGYYTSWGKKTIRAAHLKRLTHVIYAFIEMNSDGSVSIGSADRATSTDPEKDKQITIERLEALMSLAGQFPHLKVMFAVGGWANSQYFSAMAASPGQRIKFIASVIKLIERYGFDGVDIDWEYPVTGGANEGTSADKENYVTFMKELRQSLDNFASTVGRSEKFLISFASAAGQWTLDPGYNLPGLLKYADFANVMTYDFFGAWESKWGAYTGPPAPLFFGMPPRFSGKTNTDWTMKYYACKTQTPHKINMGVPFYGRYWKNVGEPVDKSDSMWRTATAVNGKFEGGYVPWNEIESDYLSNGFEKHFHEKSKAPYAFNAGTKTFLGYENVESLNHKKKYAAEKNIGGLMIWALELDDDNLSLLNTISSANLCEKTDPNLVNYKCSPIDEKRWWTSEDGDDKAGLCGRSAPLYKGYYPVCDPDDPGYSCCGAYGYCGTGEKYCKCPTCTDFANNPEKIVKEPVKPTIAVKWYFLNDPDGKRGRCGKDAPKLNGEYPICNPDDDNAHCCSNGGYCGSSPGHCDCKDCVNFRKNPNYKFK